MHSPVAMICSTPIPGALRSAFGVFQSRPRVGRGDNGKGLIMRNALWLLLVAILLAGCPDDNRTRVHGTMAPGPSEMAYDDYDSGYDDDPAVTSVDSDHGYNDDYGASYDDNEYVESYDDYGISDRPSTVGGTATPINVDPAPTPTVYTPTHAPTHTPPPTGRRTYVIQRSDTLWAISKRFLGAGNRWREILAVNPALEPRRLRIGQEIVIPPR